MPANGIDDRILALYDAQNGGAVYLRVDPALVDNNIKSDRFRPVAFQTPNGFADSLLTENDHADANSALFEDNPILTERLLHELVHHVQHHSGAYDTFPCMAYGEKEAYRLGGLYFDRHYMEDPMPNRQFWAHVYSRC